MHTFACLMYDVYQSFGLFAKGDRRAEIRASATFSGHQAFFGNRDDERHQEQKRYDQISGVLDAEQVFSTAQRREIFYKYEQLYNALMARPVFTELNRKKIQKRYALHIIPRLIALDIYKTHKDENKNSFYYHIHLFLQEDCCPCWEDKKEGAYFAVRQYLKNHIKCLKLSHTENLLPVYSVTENIRKNSSQKKGALNVSIQESIEAYQAVTTPEEVKSIKAGLDELKAAHYSLTVLLNLERQFPVINILSVYYRKYVNGGIKPNNISAMLCRYLYEPQTNDKFCHSGIISSIVDYYYSRTIKPVSLNVSNEFLQCVDKVKDIVFNFNNNAIISEASLISIAVILKKESNNKYLNSYFDLLMVIHLISQGETDAAYEKVKKTSTECLPPGYLTSAFLILYIALRIKTERKSIKKGIFSSDVSAILENQGIYIDYIPANQIYTEIHSDGSVMKSTLLSESILSDANNLTIMRSVRMYNNIVRRVSDWNDLELDGIYPESVYGLLDKVDAILGKILNIIFFEKITSSQDLAFTLKNKKVLARGELNDSLIGILINCPLLACVRDLESLIKYLRCPGEEIRNMILSVDRKSWDLIYEALTILEKERKIQTGKTQRGGK
ncbi:TPA: hypothetical protein ACQC5M_002617 [Escherichia albertii]|uniref:hypothetical protein n=1 Tax=Escherichia albertii TaxID=208962 RepID=UPI000743B2A0|nr:hypothetical protein [Escherichia albertii]PFF96514.1 hypothetical protein CRH02_06130 [Escherichia albertii]HEB1543784.1 hypothetical protein [Escherichia albertii]